jgi:F0F1-type ATP synthase assembly protein I
MAAPSPEKNDGNKNIWLQIGKYSHMALALPASVVAGLIIGAALDRWLKTSYWTLIGLLLGCIAGFTELIRAILKSGRES